MIVRSQWELCVWACALVTAGCVFTVVRASTILYSTFVDICVGIFSKLSIFLCAQCCSATLWGNRVIMRQYPASTDNTSAFVRAGRLFYFLAPLYSFPTLLNVWRKPQLKCTIWCATICARSVVHMFSLNYCHYVLYFCVSIFLLQISYIRRLIPKLTALSKSF